MPEEPVYGNFSAMLNVVCSNEDIPNAAAEEKAIESIKNGKPVIITSNGGQDKTSLMLRTAVSYARKGNIILWMKLSEEDVISEKNADRFWKMLEELAAPDKKILLCIDAPYNGIRSFENLQNNYCCNENVGLIMAERKNRLSQLAKSNSDMLIGWFDNAEVISLFGDAKYKLNNYHVSFFPGNIRDSKAMKRRILEKLTSFYLNDEAEVKKYQKTIINNVLDPKDLSKINIIELIYRTLFELKKIPTKQKSVKLDWDEWNDTLAPIIKKESEKNALYGIIAALYAFEHPMDISLFCKYFEINERQFTHLLNDKMLKVNIEPVIYDTKHNTIKPKHDIIAKLFFIFHSGESIDQYLKEIIDFMNEDEIESFLKKAIVKNDIIKKDKKSGKFKAYDIDHLSFIKLIIKKMDDNMLNLTAEGKAWLCCGYIWAEKDFNKIKNVLEKYAPPIENKVIFLKLYTEWGISEAENNMYEDAENNFKRVINTDPENLQSRTELGKLLAKQKGREYEAEKILRKAINIDPKHLQSRTELGRLLAKQKGREDEAEKYLREANKIDSKHLHSRTELGRLLAKQKGREKDAENILREAMKIDSKHLQSRTELGRLLAKQKGREKDAEDIFKEVIDIDKNNLQSRTELGKLLAKQKGREKDAENILREAMKIDSKHLQSRTELGRLLAKQKGREDEAEKYLREAMGIDSKHLHSRVELGKLYEKLGKFNEAKALYEEVLKIESNNKYGKEGLERLKNIK